MYILQSEHRSVEKARTQYDWRQCFDLALPRFVSITYMYFEYAGKVVKTCLILLISYDKTRHSYTPQHTS